MSYLSEDDEKLISQCVPDSMENAFNDLWNDLLAEHAVEDDDENRRMAWLLFKMGAWNAGLVCSFAMMTDGLKGIKSATTSLLAETNPTFFDGPKH
tara:strand:+ start:653 stop:940 length:288 start_codon:yes stop_codon:yes gene_type:complete